MLNEVLYCWDIPWGSIPQEVNVAGRSLTWKRGVPGSIPAKNQLFWLMSFCGCLDQLWDKPKVTFIVFFFLFFPRFVVYWLHAFHCYMTSSITSLWTVFAEMHNTKNILLMCLVCGMVYDMILISFWVCIGMSVGSAWTKVTVAMYYHTPPSSFTVIV